jgi:DNA topoisomerase I
VKKLLVVESPNKVAKIGEILNKWEPGTWRVVATVGHWRGLPPMAGQSFEETVNPGRGFTEGFVVLPGKEEVVSRLRASIDKADEVYLGTDGDHEGEAIAWHVNTHFKLRGARRVTANEITAKGITAAIKTAGEIDLGVVEAQRARVVLDYLIGMEVSRLLWRFGAKSAGRLQSCALRVLAARERAIRAFKSVPFWTVGVAYHEGFEAVLGVCGKPTEEEVEAGEAIKGESKLKPQRFLDEAEAKAALASIQGVEHVVEKVEAKAGERRPPAPFTTATLLSAASRELGFPVAKTTQLAQGLFERGVITYIRTDSTAVSDDAVLEIRSYLGAHHPEALPDEAVKARMGAHAQGAHEAIRPTHMTLVVDGLDADSEILYRLIFFRTLCCQAKPAITRDITLTIRPGRSSLRLVAHDVAVEKLGWLEIVEGDRKDRNALAAITEGQQLSVKQAGVVASKTKAPPRFSEETLVSYLERRGVGRPSTYAPMLATLHDRGYVRDEKRSLVPEDLGLLADELVGLAFDEIAQEGFTARTEGAFELIAGGKLSRETFLSKFYGHFSELKKAASAAYAAYAAAHPELDRDRVVPYDKPCPACGSSMEVRLGKHGRFARCTKEECRKILDLEPPTYHKNPCPKCGGQVVEKGYTRDEKRRVFFQCSTEGCSWASDSPPPRVSKKPCPTCGGRLILRKSAKGKFWGCARYPECRGVMPYERRVRV